MKVGVLALQGDVREHIEALRTCEVEAFAVRRASEIEGIDALILPGGESTTIAQLAEVFGIFELIKSKLSNGMPV
jgi:5'-phosphate synthase pdxT subunit